MPQYIEKEVFRTGNHVDMTGETTSWTTLDLDTIVAQYNERSNADLAPVVFGHPEINSPCYGWLTKLWRKGDSLFALLRCNDDGVLYTAVSEGKYKNVSLSITNFEVIHVGFLGAALPAISGMSEPILYGKKKSGSIIQITKKSYAMEPEIEQLKAGITAIDGRVTAMEQTLSELKESIAAIAAQLGETVGEEPQEDSQADTVLADQIEELRAEANASAFTAFKNWLDTEEVSARITPATKIQALKTAEKVKAAVASFSRSPEINELKELILSMPKNEFRHGVFSKPTTPYSAESSSLENRIARYKKEKSIAN